ncbi:TPA: hypothetical protein HA325_04210, partial [Candidatus Thalassarchaeaceae archaeon]
MAKRGLGRSLADIAEASGEGPDLSSFVESENELEIGADSPNAAVLWMIFGSICFGTMNALVKYTSGLDG